MIKYLIMDVDGSLTDGKIYMGPNGEAMKAFSIKDGYVINFILKPAEIIPIIITARTSSIVQNRCNELGINEVYQGKLDKFSTLIQIVGESHLGECAYFGDDIIDLKCMLPIKNAGGIVGCPADAVSDVKFVSDYVCINKAGEGALREFSEWLVSGRIDESLLTKRVNSAVNYIKSLDCNNLPIGKKITVYDYFFYSVQSYYTIDESSCRLESHRRYIDIQMMISGKERLDFVDISRLTPQEQYDEYRDVVFWNPPLNMSNVTLTKGNYIILFPETAHRGAIKAESSEHVLKIVGKVKAF